MRYFEFQHVNDHNRKSGLIRNHHLFHPVLTILQLLSFGKPTTSTASIAFFFLYMLVFGATVNVVPWVWGPEILPLEARARGVAISVSSHWMCKSPHLSSTPPPPKLTTCLGNFCIVMITPVLLNNIGWATYIIFTVLVAAFVPIVYFCYPETSRLSLESIDNLFLPADYQVRGGSISYDPAGKGATEYADSGEKV